jgi:glycosyltransferase involved in cell wall biosynthesis
VLVTVIIPAFDAAEYIRQALNSVLAQTYQAIEVIVVDDGSSDATSAIVREFVARDSRVRLVHQSNAGAGAARNVAIRKARGKYIAPLDADDFWFPQKLEKQVACMEQCGNETGLVYCWSALVDKDSEIQAFSHPYMFEGRLRHVLVLRNIVGNGSVPLFRAAALERVGPYLTRADQGGAQGCEDWDLNLRVAEIYSARVVPEYLVAYRQSSHSMSNKAESMVASFASTIRRARQRNCDLPSAAFRWSAGYFYLYLEDKCCDFGHFSWSLRYLKEAVHANPVLLLKTGIYRKFMKGLLDLITGSNGNNLTKQVRPSSEEKRNQADLHPKKKRKRRFISNRIFRHVEQTRWSAALDDEA